MCIVFVANGLHPEFPLVVAANRDEFITRPATPAHLWPASEGRQHQGLLAGRDQLAGGTWLGVNPHDGRWAALVNVAPPHSEATASKPQSRGTLPLRWLGGANPREPPSMFAARMAVDPAIIGMAGTDLLHCCRSKYPRRTRLLMRCLVPCPCRTLDGCRDSRRGGGVVHQP